MRAPPSLVRRGASLRVTKPRPRAAPDHGHEAPANGLAVSEGNRSLGDQFASRARGFVGGIARRTSVMVDHTRDGAAYRGASVNSAPPPPAGGEGDERCAP